MSLASEAKPALQISNPKAQAPNKDSNFNSQNAKHAAMANDTGAQLLDIEDWDFAWSLGIGIWDLSLENIRLKLDLFRTNSAVQGL